ncbi:hypothetical protein MUA02_21110 [Enterobacteriaceae bacterium H20N1]|uniref:Phage tail protein C-terminal domain-containing protein n=1 Tax=Dryocola boscaweniae TaxID=2925397 RepID=A0A9X3ABW5_9ENTR|nr:hypothetical protein [Dryocola boscaweniae]MCT4701238.1 hypothetical protein [Dryocola boscaweniae]MCT4721520.1 hypothetical protein [Dryocola boscaweniae]
MPDAESRAIGFSNTNGNTSFPTQGPYMNCLWSYDLNSAIMHAVQAGNATPVHFFRCRTTAGWQAWQRYWTSTNTTQASDGTLKAASPIIKLFADGSFETNAESEGCTVQRLRVGEYLIEGCEALNADAGWGGWDGGFDIPTDKNKQPLIWLDYEVNADGSVFVKTYHRTYPDSPAFARNEIDGLSDGDPVDIPADQFVSVRVEMPQDSVWNQRQAAV